MLTKNYMLYKEDLMHLKVGLSNEIWEKLLKVEDNAENVKTVKRALKELQGVFNSISRDNDIVSPSTMLEKLQSIANTISSNKKLKCSMEVWNKYYEQEIRPYLSMYHIFRKANLDFMIIPHYMFGEDYLKKSNKPPIEKLTKASCEEKLKSLVIGGMTQIECGLLCYYDLAKTLQPLKHIQSLLKNN